MNECKQMNVCIQHLFDRFDTYQVERNKQNEKIKIVEDKVEQLENEINYLVKMSTTWNSILVEIVSFCMA